MPIVIPEESTVNARFVHYGSSIDHTPAADLAVGEVVVAGELVGVSNRPVKAGDLGTLSVSGVFDFAKATGGGTAIPLGAKAYWDAANAVATADDAAGTNKYIGKVVKAAADADPLVRVRLSQ